MSLFNDPLQIIIILFLLSLLPLFVVMGTSFVKISIVFSMLRNALGIQQIPPNMALYGLSLILTIFIMAPVGIQIKNKIEENPINMNDSHFYEKINSNTLDPYRVFLERHTKKEQIIFFSQIGKKIWPKEYQTDLDSNSLIVLMPAFAVGQLIEAFKIGLLLFLPFIAIDIIVSNVLLAMGMMMVSPMTISLPFKILVFVLMSGWEKLISQLMLSYS